MIIICFNISIIWYINHYFPVQYVHTSKSAWIMWFNPNWKTRTGKFYRPNCNYSHILLNENKIGTFIWISSPNSFEKDGCIYYHTHIYIFNNIKLYILFWESSLKRFIFHIRHSEKQNKIRKIQVSYLFPTCVIYLLPVEERLIHLITSGRILRIQQQ